VEHPTRPDRSPLGFQSDVNTVLRSCSVVHPHLKSCHLVVHYNCAPLSWTTLQDRGAGELPAHLDLTASQSAASQPVLSPRGYYLLTPSQNSVRAACQGGRASCLRAATPAGPDWPRSGGQAPGGVSNYCYCL
jgi:hypothetical protein